MKKLIIGILSVITLLFTPICASAAPVMFSMYAGPGFAIGIKHKSQLDNLRNDLDEFAKMVGCEPIVRSDEVKGKFNNYIADHPVGVGRPSAEWLQGLGKAVGADYINLVYSDYSGVHGGGYFHTSVRMNIQTDLRIVQAESGETIFTGEAPEMEGKDKKVLESVETLLTKAATEMKKQGIRL